MTPAQDKRASTIKRKSVLMTQFLLDYEKFSKKRVTPDLIRSPRWKEMQKRYVELFMPLMEGSAK